MSSVIIWLIFFFYDCQLHNYNLANCSTSPLQLHSVQPVESLPYIFPTIARYKLANCTTSAPSVTLSSAWWKPTYVQNRFTLGKPSNRACCVLTEAAEKTSWDLGNSETKIQFEINNDHSFWLFYLFLFCGAGLLGLMDWLLGGYKEGLRETWFENTQINNDDSFFLFYLLLILCRRPSLTDGLIIGRV